MVNRGYWVWRAVDWLYLGFFGWCSTFPPTFWCEFRIFTHSWKIFTFRVSSHFGVVFGKVIMVERAFFGFLSSSLVKKYEKHSNHEKILQNLFGRFYVSWCPGGFRFLFFYPSLKNWFLHRRGFFYKLQMTFFWLV